ncbi:antibiotic biosynthesis monooxygenase [Mesorhizobium sp. CU2]|uniref:putative quinol monooxygenase n=1 Tax=unclassified Mesorhizobium TaxID=325217 RepID=UPI00112B3B57|nr:MULTISPECIES: putative quinol monooxygenase [unclassified Mesorhizobium]TPN82679.1 antibiotic biosynthesis monooxygenase [Mesorhizobium sp. CU3]TPO16446.1 antibiotic biosynthesis monooxygenase [Mesorhizobium sp. CU2]
MLLIIGTVRLPPDMLEQAKPAMQRMILASRAEPGCLQYSYAQDVLDTGLIHVSEAWSDRAALDAHFNSAHIAEWRASWVELGIGERKLTLYETDGGAPT